jgi:hypothetical protein
MQSLYIKNCQGIDVKWLSKRPNCDWLLALTRRYTVGFQNVWLNMDLSLELFSAGTSFVHETELSLDEPWQFFHYV